MSNSTAPWRFVRFDETEVEQVPGRSHHWYVKPGMVKDTDFLFVRCIVQPGQGHNFHHHPKMEEILYILTGTAEQWVEQEKRTLKAGESFYVAAGVVHATFNVSKEPLEFLAILSPASTGGTGHGGSGRPGTVEIFAGVKTLHLYLLRQVAATLVMTVVVFTFILLLGNMIREILSLIANQQASLGVIVKAIGYLVPYVLSFSLPIGMLTAALLTFGRFSADQELTAARASGVSLISLATPVLVMSVVLSGVCAWLNFDLAPRCRVAYRELITNASFSHPTGLLRPNQFVTIKKYTIRAEKVASDGIHVENVMIFQADDQGDTCLRIKAPLGTFTPDLAHHRIIVNLQNAFGARRNSTGWEPLGNSGNFQNFPIEFGPTKAEAITIPITDMTFWQLWRTNDEIIKVISGTPANPVVPDLAAKQARKSALDMALPVLVQIHRQVSFSFACIGFTLVGIPLGIRAHRRETSAGVAMALLLVLIYYSFIIIAQAWQHHPERQPWLIMWVPTFLFQLVGGFLLWRANRGV